MVILNYVMTPDPCKRNSAHTNWTLIELLHKKNTIICDSTEEGNNFG